MDPQFPLKLPVGLLVGKTTIGAQNNGHLAGVAFTDQPGYGTHPVRIISSVIGMGAAFPEDDIYQERPPADMQGLKPLLALVGGFVAFALSGTVIVQYHRINAQLYDFWLFNFKTPYKQFVEYFIEDEIRDKGEFGKVALDLVGRSQLASLAFQYCGKPFIFFPLVKPRYGHI